MLGRAAATTCIFNFFLFVYLQSVGWQEVNNTPTYIYVDAFKAICPKIQVCQFFYLVRISFVHRALWAYKAPKNYDLIGESREWSLCSLHTSSLLSNMLVFLGGFLDIRYIFY